MTAERPELWNHNAACYPWLKRQLRGKTRILDRAAALLDRGGLLLIVGLGSPSTPGDRLLEILRVIPCAALSRLHRQRSAEDLGVPVSYELPPMGEVRALIRHKLPGARLRQGLYYRWLLRWEKP